MDEQALRQIIGSMIEEAMLETDKKIGSSTYDDALITEKVNSVITRVEKLEVTQPTPEEKQAKQDEQAKKATESELDGYLND